MAIDFVFLRIGGIDVLRLNITGVIDFSRLNITGCMDFSSLNITGGMGQDGFFFKDEHVRVYGFQG